MLCHLVTPPVGCKACLRIPGLWGRSRREEYRPEPRSLLPQQYVMTACWKRFKDIFCSSFCHSANLFEYSLHIRHCIQPWERVKEAVMFLHPELTISSERETGQESPYRSMADVTLANLRHHRAQRKDT